METPSVLEAVVSLAQPWPTQCERSLSLAVAVTGCLDSSTARQPLTKPRPEAPVSVSRDLMAEAYLIGRRVLGENGEG